MLTVLSGITPSGLNLEEIQFIAYIMGFGLKYLTNLLISPPISV